MAITKESPEEIEKSLRGFYCTDKYYHHGPSHHRVVMTDGVEYLRSAASCFWLLDIISIAWRTAWKVREEEFQVWKLQKHDDNSATVTCTDGGKDGETERVLYQQEIPYTDFPLSEIKLYGCLDDIGLVILLPGEY